MSKKVKDLSPVIKWAGGKEQELKYILPNLPSKIYRFIEPFVGGGAVYFSMDTAEKLINDKSTELINLYNDIKYNNCELVQNLQRLQNTWLFLESFLSAKSNFFITTYTKYKNSKIEKNELNDNIKNFLKENKKELKKLLSDELNEQYNIFEKELFRNISSKLIRMKELELKKGNLSQKDIFENFECALKGSFYMFIRALYNQNHFENSHYFYFIREYCYSSMFRYNAKGEFNVPYGGISYNRKNFQRKIDYIKSNELQEHFYNTQVFNLDFEEFMYKINLSENDFIFLDPPYDTDFSSYANNSFDQNDQERLADYLINNCPAKFMLIIKDTDFISRLYSNKGLYINYFDKKYMVSFKNRNDKDCQHLIITNYKIGAKNNNLAHLNHKKQLQYA